MGSSIQDVVKLKDILNKTFEMKDLGVIEDYIGINVCENINEGAIYLNQTQYLNHILTKYGMQDCKPINTPLDFNADLSILKSTNVDEKYH